MCTLILLNALFSIVKDAGAHFQSLPPRLHLALTCRHTYRLATIASWYLTHDDPTPRMLPLTLSTAPLTTILISIRLWVSCMQMCVSV